MTEEWRQIPGYEGYYEVSSLGNVRSIDRVVFNKIGRKYAMKGVVRKLRFDRDGYTLVDLYNNEKFRTHKVHRLVASSFLGVGSSALSINHKDMNRSNNAVSNLEWCTHQQNTDHAIATRGRIPGPSKPVVGKKDGCEDVVLTAICRANLYGFNRNMIHSCLSGVRDKYKGYTWSYI